jgi:uncharacterized protein (DUF1697 family)
MSKGIIVTGAMESAVKELIEKARNNVDMDALKEMLMELYGIDDIDSLEYSAGEFVVESNQPAIRMDYKLTFTIPVHFDLKGNVMLNEEYEEYEGGDEFKAMEEAVEEAGEQAGEQAQNF